MGFKVNNMIPNSSEIDEDLKNELYHLLLKIDERHKFKNGPTGMFWWLHDIINSNLEKEQNV